MSSIGFAIAYAASAIGSQQPMPIQFVQSVTGTTVTVCIDGQKVEETFAGKLGFRDASSSWTSVCADVRSPVRAGQIYGVHLLHTSKVGGNVAKAGNIVAKFFRAAQTDAQCAGLQLAVWKALEDGADQPDFSTGHLQARASIPILAYANYYYQAINTPGDALYLMAAGAGQAADGGGQASGGGQGQGQMTTGS